MLNHHSATMLTVDWQLEPMQLGERRPQAVSPVRQELSFEWDGETKEIRIIQENMEPKNVHKLFHHFREELSFNTLVQISQNSHSMEERPLAGFSQVVVAQAL